MDYAIDNSFYVKAKELLDKLEQNQKLQQLASANGIDVKNSTQLNEATRDNIATSVIALMLAKQNNDPRYANLVRYGMDHRKTKVELINAYKDQANQIISRAKNNDFNKLSGFAEAALDSYENDDFEMVQEARTELDVYIPKEGKNGGPRNSVRQKWELYPLKALINAIINALQRLVRSIIDIKPADVLRKLQAMTADERNRFELVVDANILSTQSNFGSLGPSIITTIDRFDKLCETTFEGQIDTFDDILKHDEAWSMMLNYLKAESKRYRMNKSNAKKMMNDVTRQDSLNVKADEHVANRRKNNFDQSIDVNESKGLQRLDYNDTVEIVKSLAEINVDELKTQIKNYKKRLFNLSKSVLKTINNDHKEVGKFVDERVGRKVSGKGQGFARVALGERFIERIHETCNYMNRNIVFMINDYAAFMSKVANLGSKNKRPRAVVEDYNMIEDRSDEYLEYDDSVFDESPYSDHDYEERGDDSDFFFVNNDTFALSQYIEQCLDQYDDSDDVYVSEEYIMEAAKKKGIPPQVAVGYGVLLLFGSPILITIFKGLMKFLQWLVKSIIKGFNKLIKMITSVSPKKLLKQLESLSDEEKSKLSVPVDLISTLDQNGLDGIDYEIDIVEIFSKFGNLCDEMFYGPEKGSLRENMRDMFNGGDHDFVSNNPWFYSKAALTETINQWNEFYEYLKSTSKKYKYYVKHAEEFSDSPEKVVNPHKHQKDTTHVCYLNYEELHRLAKRLSDFNIADLESQIKKYKSLAKTINTQLKQCYTYAGYDAKGKPIDDPYERVVWLPHNHFDRKHKAFKGGEQKKFFRIMNKVFSYIDMFSYGMINDYSTMLSKLVKLNLNSDKKSEGSAIESNKGDSLPYSEYDYEERCDDSDFFFVTREQYELLSEYCEQDIDSCDDEFYLEAARRKPKKVGGLGVGDLVALGICFLPWLYPKFTAIIRFIGWILNEFIHLCAKLIRLITDVSPKKLLRQLDALSENERRDLIIKVDVGILMNPDDNRYPFESEIFLLMDKFVDLCDNTLYRKNYNSPSEMINVTNNWEELLDYIKSITKKNKYIRKNIDRYADDPDGFENPHMHYKNKTTVCTLHYDQIHKLAEHLAETDLSKFRSTIHKYKSRIRLFRKEQEGKVYVNPQNAWNKIFVQWFGIANDQDFMFRNGEPKKLARIMTKTINYINYHVLQMMNDYSTILSKLVKKDLQKGVERRRAEFDEKVKQPMIPMKTGEDATNIGKIYGNYGSV